MIHPGAPRLLVLGFLALTALPSPVEAQRAIARLIGGFGFNEIYGAGVGGSVGGEFPFIRDRLFFVGVRALFHNGKEGELPAIQVPGKATPEGTLRQFHYGIEIGATWMEAPVYIRTVGGIGIARVRVTLDRGEASLVGNEDKLQFGPGVLLGVPRDDWFFGLETRWVKVQDVENSIALYATIGKKL